MINDNTIELLLETIRDHAVNSDRVKFKYIKYTMSGDKNYFIYFYSNNKKNCITIGKTCSGPLNLFKSYDIQFNGELGGDVLDGTVYKISNKDIRKKIDQLIEELEHMKNLKEGADIEKYLFKEFL